MPHADAENRDPPEKPPDRVGRLRRVAKVQLQLIRVFQIPFAAMAEGPLHEFVDRELLLLDRAVLLRNRSRLLDNQRVTGGEVVGKRSDVDRVMGVFGLHDTMKHHRRPKVPPTRGNFLSKS